MGLESLVFVDGDFSGNVVAYIRHLVKKEVALAIKNMQPPDCDDCQYYKYSRCEGNDCYHPSAPIDRGEMEPLAENRKGKTPLWCPALKEAQ